LFNEYKEKSKKLPANLKELKEKRKAIKEEQSRAALAEKNEILSKRKWDDAKFDRFAQWANSIKGIHLATIWDTLEARRTGTSPLPLAGLPGGQPLQPSKMKADIDALFGPDRR